MNLRKICQVLRHQAQKQAVKILVLFFIAISANLFSQNENKKWYFGVRAGLDFMTTPPTVLTNGNIIAPEGASSISDAMGNLLFYTAGDTIYNSAHQIMANGTGVLGEKSSTQVALIVKQPGSATLYYIFTNDAQGASVPVDGCRYTIVDMSLAAGMGSVTTKNVLLHSPTSEKMSGTLHCNGQDVWVVTHEYNSANFRAYLLTSSGITNTVVSNVGYNVPYNGNGADFGGQLKISAVGKKLAMTFAHSNLLQIFDFDKSVGTVSSAMTFTPSNNAHIYGCEFSPDGSKLYTGSNTSGINKLLQWDLCAGTTQQAIQSSQISIMTTLGMGDPQMFGSLQLGPDGKIYVARFASYGPLQPPLKKMSIINDPNLSGMNCNYVDTVLNLNPGYSFLSLPK